MAVTRIKNNQITDSTITGGKIASATLTGGLFATSLTMNSNVSIVGNLTVTGTTSTVSSTNTFINDPLVVYNNGYTGSLSNYSIGLLVNRNLASLADYGSVNMAWVWDEAEGAFVAIATTDTGSGITSINNSGYGNVKLGNAEVVSKLTAGSLIVTDLAVTDMSVTTLVATNFSSGNAQVSGGYADGFTIGGNTAASATFTTVNADEVTSTTGNAQSWYATELNSTTGNVTTLTSTTVNAGTTTSATLNATSGNITTLTAPTVDAGTTTTATLNSTSGNVTTLTSTTVNAITTTSTTLNATTGNITTATAGSMAVSDLTDNRIVVAGTSGELEDDANLTWDGSDLDVTGGLNVTGDLAVDNIAVNGNDITSTDTNGDINITPDGTGEVVASTLAVSDLTDNRVLLAGTSGAVEDDANFTFDGTTMAITAAVDVTGDLDVDNININGDAISNTNTNSGISLVPNGTGEIVIGTGSAAATLTTSGAHDLVLDTNAGTDSGTIVITDGANGDITITPNGTGDLVLDGLNWPQADGSSGQAITTDAAGQLSFTTVMTDVVQDTTPQLGGDLDVNGQSIISASNGDINITPNGTGNVVISTMILSDTTPTHILYSDDDSSVAGSSSMTWDGTDVTLASLVVSDLTDNRVLIAGSSGAVEDDSNLTYDGTNLTTNGLVATTADINGGTIDGTAIGGSTAAAGAFTTLSASGTSTLAQVDATVITGATVNATTGNVTTLTGTTATITTVNAGTTTSATVNATTGNVTTLTATDVINTTLVATNFSSGNVDINGGAIDGTNVGAASAGTGAFTTLSASGNTTVTSNQSSGNTGSGALVVTGGVGIGENLNVGGDVTITGDLVVQGDATTFNVSDLTVEDKNIIIANNSADATAADGASISIDLGSDGFANIFYTQSDDSFNFNKNVNLTELTLSTLNASAGNITTLSAPNFSSSNVQLTGGYVDNVHVGANTAATVTATTLTADSASIGDLTNNRVVIAGASGELEDDANFTFDGTTMAITAAVDVTGDLDVDNINVNGNDITSTNTNGAINLTPNGSGEVVASTMAVSDLTDNRVVIAGTSGALEDDSNLTYDGTNLTTNGLVATTGTVTTLNAGTTTSATVNATTGNITTLTSTDSAITTLVATNFSSGNVDINGGDIDGVDIGATTAGTADFTTLTADDSIITTLVATNLSGGNIAMTGGYVDNVHVGANTAASGSFTTLSASGTSTLAGVDATTVTSAVVNATTGNITTLTSTTVNAGTTTSATVNATTGNVTTLTAGSLAVSDLTDNRVVVAGTSGELEDDANFTWDGSELALTGLLRVTGNVTADNISIDGQNIGTPGGGDLTIQAGGGADNVIIKNSQLIEGAHAVSLDAITLDSTSANITTGVVDNFSSANVDIDGGAIDGTTIGGTTAAAGSFTTLDASGTSTLAGVDATTVTSATINGTTGNITTLTSTTVNAATATATNLNGTNGNVTTLVSTNFSSGNVDINGGAIDGTNIGAASAGTGAFTTLDASGVSTLAGNIVGSSGTASTSDTTGALVLTGSGGAGIGGNINVGGGALLNIDQTANYDVKVYGANDTSLLWARSASAYDAVLIGNSATASTFVSGAKLQINTTDSILLPSGTTAQRPGSTGGTDTTGMLRYNTSIDNLEFYDGTEWNTAGTTFTVIASQTFSGDDSTTAFTLSEAQTTASCIVSINGVVQLPTTAYSVSSTTLTFTEAPATGDVIEVRKLTTTQTVSGLTSSNSYVQVATDDDGIKLYSGSGAATLRWTIDTGGNLIPAGNTTQNIGSPTAQIGDIYVSSGTIHLGTLQLKDNGDDTLGIFGSDGTTPAGTVVNDFVTGDQGDVRFMDADSSNFVAFQAPATVSSNVTWTLPDADAGVSGYALVSDAAGTLSWAAAGATISQDETTNTNFNLYFASTTSGALTSVKYDSGLSYNPSTGTLTTEDMVVSGDLTVNGATTTISTTNLTVEDTLIEINSGAASNANDLGLLMERGSTGDNVFIGWDESADRIKFATTTATADATGDLTLTSANIEASYAHVTSTQSLYADLAENYQADEAYSAGTVLEFGGEHEVTEATEGTTRVAGIVSTDPAHLMNGGLKGSNVVPLALMGRVPCKAIGPVAKGDMMVSAGHGYAKASGAPGVGTVIGKALEALADGEKGTIEVVVGKI